AERVGVPLQFGELAHPLQVRRPLHVQVAVGRPAEQQGEHHLGEQLAGQVRLRRGRLRPAPPPPRPAPSAAAAPPPPPPPGRAGEGGRVHLAVAQRPAPAEVRVVVPFQVI